MQPAPTGRLDGILLLAYQDDCDFLVIFFDASTDLLFDCSNRNFLSHVLFGVYKFDFLDCGGKDEPSDLGKAKPFYDITCLYLDCNFTTLPDGIFLK